MPDEISRPLRHAATPLRSVFLDFDGTVCASNSFSEALLRRCQRACGCSCTATTGPGSLADAARALPAANLTAALEGDNPAAAPPGSRLQRLRGLLGELRRAELRVRLLSTSWWPVGAEAWHSYLSVVAAAADLGFAVHPPPPPRAELPMLVLVLTLVCPTGRRHRRAGRPRPWAGGRQRRGHRHAAGRARRGRGALRGRQLWQHRIRIATLRRVPPPPFNGLRGS